MKVLDLSKLLALIQILKTLAITLGYFPFER
jgi:hypothetical protein